MEIRIIPIHTAEKELDFFQTQSTIRFGASQIIQKEDVLNVYIGLGDRKLSSEDIRFLGGVCRKALNTIKNAIVRIDYEPIVSQSMNPQISETISSFMEGWYLATYQFLSYKKEKDLASTLTFRWEEEHFNEWEQSAYTRAAAVNVARDLCNEPANKLTPTTYAHALKELFKDTDVMVDILEGEALTEERFPGIVAVSRGSSEPAKFAILTLNRDSDQEKVALVGKGVTFDSGGINAKTASDIGEMKMDMGGSAAVVGAMKLLADTNATVHVIAILPLVENLADGNAFLPSDVIEYPNGLHVEVGNTDAEGRLILADGIVYAQSVGAKTIIDIATLTGSIGSALGLKAAGVFSNVEEDLWQYKKLGDETGDYIWPMPVYDDYLHYLKSDTADVNNMSSSQFGGAITAALFLKQFIEPDKKWIHIDMANTVRPWKVQGYYVLGASGYGVRLLYELVKTENNR